MNLTNESEKYLNENHSSGDDDDGDDDDAGENQAPLIRIENFFSDHDDDELGLSDDDDDDGDVDADQDGDDDDDDDQSDIENHYYRTKTSLNSSTRLSSILRQSTRLVELKLNPLENRSRNVSHPSQSLRHALSDSDMSKHSSTLADHRIDQDHPDQPSLHLSTFSSNNFYLSTHRSQRLYLPSSFLFDLQPQITNWLQSSTHLIDSISTYASYHRQCWPQLLLTYFIERGIIHLEFLRCTHSFSVTSMNEDFCSIHKHGCVLEEQAYKLSSILQKGSRFQIDPLIFDHIRRVIVIKSMQEVNNDNSNLQQIYVKQLKSLKQSLFHQHSSLTTMTNNSSISVASLYSKLLLFLSSLYSIKSETMQTLFCQHLLHNPMYSYLLTSS